MQVKWKECILVRLKALFPAGSISEYLQPLSQDDCWCLQLMSPVLMVDAPLHDNDRQHSERSQRAA